MSDIILEACKIKKYFVKNQGLFRPKGYIRAVDDVSIRIERGETFAIVGESGCGKSTLARVLMQLLEPTSGDVVFDNVSIQNARGKVLKKLRSQMQFVFQDPFSSLNPRMSVGKLIGEPIETHWPEFSSSERRKRVADLLRRVGLRPGHADRYPHEFSGGQRQRIGIARALASDPKLIIADEPVSALDVSVQAQIINQLDDLKHEFNLTLIIIAHDLAVIRHMSDRVAVMYLGQIVESGTTEDVFKNPHHPYTLTLLSAIPEPIHGQKRHGISLKGETPSPANPPSGCRFHTRCPFAQAKCITEIPALRSLSNSQQVACHFAENVRQTASLPHTTEMSQNVKQRFALYNKAILAKSQTPDPAKKTQEGRLPTA